MTDPAQRRGCSRKQTLMLLSGGVAKASLGAGARLISQPSRARGESKTGDAHTTCRSFLFSSWRSTLSLSCSTRKRSVWSSYSLTETRPLAKSARSCVAYFRVALKSCSSASISSAKAAPLNVFRDPTPTLESRTCPQGLSACVNF